MGESFYTFICEANVNPIELHDITLTSQYEPKTFHLTSLNKINVKHLFTVVLLICPLNVH